MRVYIADTETTGTFEEQKQPEVIELAYAELMRIDGAPGIGLGSIYERRYMPTQLITYGAMATHHIRLSELKNCPPSSEAKLPEDCHYLIGHNIEFDWKALGSPPDVKRICTLAMARRVWAEEQGHSLGACLYRLLGDDARDRLKNSHSAKADLENCFTLLSHFLLIKGDYLKSWNDVHAWSEDCRIPRVWTFGKHRGKKIGAENNGLADTGYHGWVVRQVEMNENVKKAIYKFREGTL